MYKALVARIHTRPHPNADKLQLGTCGGYQVIVGKDVEDGTLGLFFEQGGQLSEEFAAANDLLRRKDEDGNPAGGMFEANRRVRAIKLRGEKSEGFWCPLEMLRFAHGNALFFSDPLLEIKEGDEFDTYAGMKICQRYETPATRRQMKNGKAQKSNAMFAKHIDTKQFKRAAGDIPADSLVIITEKLHGTCVPYNARIRMADGTVKRINKISPGEYVLGIDGDLKPIPTLVKNVWQHGMADKWLKITGPREGIGRGNSSYNLNVTPEHLVMVRDRGWVEARHVTAGDEVLMVRNTFDAEAFFLLIAPYVPPCMQYKLPVRYRGGDGWIPSSKQSYKPSTKWQIVTNVTENRTIASAKWDLETETGNFLAHDILVHNSFRFGRVLDDVPIKRGVVGRMIARVLGWPTTKREWVYLHGSRNVVIGTRTGGFYGTDGFRFDAMRGVSLHKGEVLYGELVGYTDTGAPIMPSHDTRKLNDKEIAKCFGDTMNYTYGCNPGECKAFIYRITQVNEDGVVFELNWNDVRRRCGELGLNAVPEITSIYRAIGLAWGVESYCQHDRQSLLDTRHIREGVVVRYESRLGTGWLKQKTFTFSVLEGILKDTDDYVDTEEAA